MITRVSLCEGVVTLGQTDPCGAAVHWRLVPLSTPCTAYLA